MKKKHSSGFLAIVNEAKKKIKEIDIHAVKKMIENQESFYLLDVREDHEWEKGHLPGAMHLSKGVIERDIEKLITDKNAKIVLYCSGGFRSAIATANIQKMGYTNVISMEGGSRTWQEAGFPIVHDR